MVYRQKRGALGAAFQPTVKAMTFPASVGGVNALDSIMAMPSQDCLYTYNAMPVEYGLRLRKGYREWATGCGTNDVHTMIAYESQKQDAAQDRLWAVTPDGIWNVTTFATTSPTLDVTFNQTGDQAGYGVQCEFTNDASKHYMFYADALNGLHQYEEGVGWSVPVSGTDPGQWYYKNAANEDTGFPIDDIAFVMVHKLRIWVILEDSDDAWYLPLYSVAGELKKFTFGAKLIHGGNLMGLFNWTVDGGDGVDDYMVAVSRGGDVAMYRGSDPESADWTTTGTWFIGEVPESRRVSASHGGNLYLLSTYGITSLRDLLEGVLSSDDLRASPSAKVNRFLRNDIETGADLYEWSINIHPADGFMQVVTPEPTNTPYLQYNQNLSTRAWGFWEGVPMKCGSTWNGDYFMGGKSGVVYRYEGTLDGTLIDGTPGDAVKFRLLTSFQAPESHAIYKRVNTIRAIGVLAGTASVNVDAVYDYRVEVAIQQPPVIPQIGGENTWDSGVWDQSLWDYNNSGQSIPLGALGMGRAIAVGMAGNSSTRLNIVGWDVMYTSGGYM